MDWNGFVAIAGQYGPVGFLAVYLLWREEKRDKRDTEREVRWETIQKDHTQADRDLTASLTLLAERLNHVRGL